MLAAADLTGLLKTLADPTRLRMLALCDGNELAVGELSRALGMSQSRVSNHLRLLREAGLLAERRAEFPDPRQVDELLREVRSRRQQLLRAARRRARKVLEPKAGEVRRLVSTGRGRRR